MFLHRKLKTANRKPFSNRPLVPLPKACPFIYKVLARSLGTGMLRQVLTVKSATRYTGRMAKQIARQLGGHELQAVSHG